MKWKKRALAVLLAVSMIATTCPASVWAEDNLQEEISPDVVSMENSTVYSNEDFRYTELSDGTLSICEYTREAQVEEKRVSLEVPASIDGVNVAQIGEKAFANNKIIETVILPESVTYIAEDAFAECSNLKGIAFCGEEIGFASSIIKGSEALGKIFVLGDNTCGVGLRSIL